MVVHTIITEGDFIGKVTFELGETSWLSLDVWDPHQRTITFSPEGQVIDISLSASYHFVGSAKMQEFRRAFEAIKAQFEDQIAK